MQAHFRAHPVERSGEEMGSAHPGLQRAKWMLHCLTADAHYLRSLIYAGLHRIEHRLVVNCAFNLDADKLIDRDFVKRFRQRERER